MKVILPSSHFVYEKHEVLINEAMDPIISMQYSSLPINIDNVATEFHTIHWEDHFNNLVTTLKDFTLLNILTDTTLVTGNLKVPLHRVILSCFSSYIKEFLTNEVNNCYLFINDVQEPLLQSLIDYIYTGVAAVPIPNLNSWYKMTKCIRLDNLLDAGRNHSSEIFTYFVWPHHKEMLLQYLWQSRSSLADCDVILVTNNFSQVFAHSCILGACSRYLLNIFLRHSDRNKKKPYVFVLQNVKTEDLEIVLEFCYRGIISIVEENIRSVYETAELLGIQNLCRKLITINPKIEKFPETDVAKYGDVISRIKSSHFITQQSEHSYYLQNIFRNLLECEEQVDITLLKDKHSFTAHIVVLSAFSLYFKNLARCLQHNMKDAFVLVKDLRTEHLRAFLDYIYKGEAEFAGTTDVFCVVMSEWIDFNLLSISESETCQILTNTSSSESKLKRIIKNSTEDHHNMSIYNQSNSISENVIEQQQCDKNEPGDSKSSLIVQKSFQNVSVNVIACASSTDMHEADENVITSVTAERLEKMEPLADYLNGQETLKEPPDVSTKESLDDSWSNLKNEDNFEDETYERNTVTDILEEESLETTSLKNWRVKDSVLTCYTCNRNFESRKLLREHLIIHPSGKIMKCRYCGKAFNRPSQMTLHVRVHTGCKPFLCQQCGRAFAAKSALRKHIDIHAKDKSKMFECAICSKLFSRKEYLEEHIRTHTGNKPFKCEICHKSFVGRTGLNHHKKTHVGAEEKKDSVCEVCGKSFTRHALWTHVKSHEKKHNCHYCKKCFSTASALRVHVTGTHLGRRSYQCEVCGKGFIQKNHLIRHMKVHDISKDEKNAKPFLCGKCPRTFKTAIKLESHTKLEHIQPGERPFSCEICNKRFAGRSTVIYHRRAHTGERPHTCSTCGKSFMRPDALRQHVISHTGERRHQCSICNRKFATKSTLNKHINSHKEPTDTVLEKLSSLSCDMCHKSFQSKTQLSLHSRVHNSCRPLRCHVCRKSFRYQDSLTKHLLIHNNCKQDNTENELSCMYAFQLSGQTINLNSQAKDKGFEEHNYTLNHNTEKNILQQYTVPSTALTENICIADENKTSTAIPICRPYSITIDGDLCCNSNTNIASESDNINLPLPPSIPPASFHSLSQEDHNLSIHPVLSLTASQDNERGSHPHPSSVVTYNEPLSKTFLFIDGNSEISEEINRKKINR